MINFFYLNNIWFSLKLYFIKDEKALIFIFLRTEILTKFHLQINK
jgi:hypothetical protein